MSEQPNAERIPHRLRHQVPLLVWLVLVWMLLWGTWSWANLISGALLAVAVTVLLPLPPVVGGTRLHPAGLLVYLGHFVVDLVMSAAQVAGVVISTTPQHGSSPGMSLLSFQFWENQGIWT